MDNTVPGVKSCAIASATELQTCEMVFTDGRACYFANSATDGTSNPVPLTGTSWDVYIKPGTQSTLFLLPSSFAASLFSVHHDDYDRHLLRHGDSDRRPRRQRVEQACVPELHRSRGEPDCVQGDVRLRLHDDQRPEVPLHLVRDGLIHLSPGNPELRVGRPRHSGQWGRADREVRQVCATLTKIYN